MTLEGHHSIIGEAVGEVAKAAGDTSEKLITTGNVLALIALGFSVLMGFMFWVNSRSVAEMQRTFIDAIREWNREMTTMRQVQTETRDELKRLSNTVEQNVKQNSKQNGDERGASLYPLLPAQPVVKAG